MRKSPVIAAVALVLLAVALWVRGGSGAGEHRELAPLERSVERDPRAEPETERSSRAADAEPSVAPSEPAAAVAAPAIEFAEGEHEYELSILAVDACDRPIANALVYLAPERHVLDRIGRTDARGRLVARWIARRPRMPLALLVEHEEHGACGLSSLVLDAGESSARVELASASERSDDEREHMQRQLQAMRAAAQDDPRRAAEASMLQRSIQVERLPKRWNRGGEPAVRRDARGRLLFCDPWTQADAGDPDARHPEPEELTAEGEGSVVRGVVVGADGAAIAGALVDAMDLELTRIAHSATDDEGRYELSGLAPGPWRIRACAAGAGSALRDLVLAPEDEVACDLALAPGARVRGRLLTLEGEPAAGWEIELRGAPPAAWIGSARVGEEGRFALAELPHAPFALHARSPGGRERLPALEIEDVWPDLAEQTIRVDARARPATVRVRIATYDGVVRVDADVRLWKVGSGRGIVVDRAKRDGFYDDREVPPGLYTLTAGRPGEPWVELPPFEVAAGEELDLGTILLDAPGRLRIAPAEGARGRISVALLRRLEAVDSLVAELELDEHDGPWEREVLPGTYVARTANGESRVLSIHTGSEIELTVPFAGEPGR